MAIRVCEKREKRREEIKRLDRKPRPRPRPQLTRGRPCPRVKVIFDAQKKLAHAHGYVPEPEVKGSMPTGGFAPPPPDLTARPQPPEPWACFNLR